MAALKEDGYSNSDLKQLYSIPVLEIFKSHTWSKKRFQETTKDCCDKQKSLLFLKVVVKIATCDDKSCQVQISDILSTFSKQNFFSQLCKLLDGSEDVSLDFKAEWLEPLNCVIQSLHDICRKTPSKSMVAFGFCSGLASTITKLILSSNDDAAINQLSDMKSNVEDIHNYFRDLPIIPTSDDIFCKPFWGENLTYGSFHNLDHYLDVLFRLLRENFMAQLRNDIFEYKARKASNAPSEKTRLDFTMHQNVTVECENCSNDCRFYDIKLDESHVNRVKMNRTKHFLYRSLICLSPDVFETLYFAIIENEDQIRDDYTLKIKMNKESTTPGLFVGMAVTMIENIRNLETYMHVSSCLQNIHENDLPFRKYLVEGHKKVHRPLYIQDNTDIEYDLRPMMMREVIYQKATDGKEKQSRMCKVVSCNDWPTATELHLDDSQYKALQLALTREFVIIQGPPGTGKTRVGMMIAKTLIHNKHLWMNERKINECVLQRNHYGKIKQNYEPSSAMLIVCHTSHALEQFFKGVVTFLDAKNINKWESKLVHVGSRSLNLDRFSLKHKRDQWNELNTHGKNLSNPLSESHERICKIKWMLRKSYENIFGEEILKSWVPEVNLLVENGKRFNMLEWLNIDEYSLCQSALEGYFEMEIKSSKENNNNTDIDKDINTDSDAINGEKYITDNDTDVCSKYGEIGVRLDLIVHDILKRNNFDEHIEYFLKDYIKKLQSNICSNEIMSQTDVEIHVHQPWGITINERWNMYRYFLHQLRKKAKTLLDEEEIQHEDLRRKEKERQTVVDNDILAHSEVIAMTSSWAARYQNVLKEICPKIIIVEEASEISEAHVIATLNAYCEHLILIGDHKQIDRTPTGFELARKYHLDVSLFDRMINMGLPYVRLEKQHRMRPEVAQLLHSLYEKLDDNENVLEYEDVMGLEKNVYFVSHQKEDQAIEDKDSYANEFEAFYIERLTHYLLKQGYSTRQITVLTPYLGQEIMIRNQMQKAEYEGIRISNLAQYRGEENDIILLSLVSSNKEGRLGFLDDDNRMCVALSRAKIGLYVIGNFDFIQKHSHKCHIWKEIIKQMKVNESIGNGLPLICRNHKDIITQVVDPKDFDKVPEGGCSKTCDFRLNCGHSCGLFCHPLDPHHLKITCQKLCAKSCKNGHKCIKPCHFPRACKCSTAVEKKLPCGHRLTQVCHFNAKRNQCQTVVTKILPCGHHRQMRCFEDPLQFKCRVFGEETIKMSTPKNGTLFC